MSPTDNQNTGNKFYTVSEVSALLRLSTLTIYKYIKEGKISVVEFGGHYRVSETSLNKFITEHTHSSQNTSVNSNKEVTK